MGARLGLGNHTAAALQAVAERPRVGKGTPGVMSAPTAQLTPSSHPKPKRGTTFKAGLDGPRQDLLGRVPCSFQSSHTLGTVVTGGHVPVVFVSEHVSFSVQRGEQR